MRPDRSRFAVRSRRVVTPQGTRPATVVVEGERIASVGSYEQERDALNLGDDVLLPGLVDPHVHLNAPGRADWEGFSTGTAAAAAGGVTTLVDMPLNSSPVTTTPAAVDAKRVAAHQALAVDVGLWGGLVPGNAQQVGRLLDAGVLGVKAFLCHSGLDEFPAATQDDLRTAMLILAERDAPLLAHAELVGPAPTPTNPKRHAQYAASRPPEFERRAIQRLIDLCRETACRTHIVHLADGGSLPMISAARSEGLPLTVETAPHYLTFASEEVPDGATEYKCAPPVRDAANREALWRGLAEGVIDFIATDHSPCPPSMKHRDTGRFDQAWGGISSLQLLLPAVWTEAARRGHSLNDLAHWLAHRPALLPGVEAGIEAGRPANLVQFDPEAEFTVHGAQLLHRHGLTPYEGRTLRGVARRVWLRGAAAEHGRGRLLGGRQDD